MPRRREKNKNKNLHIDSGRRKKFKKSWRVTFYSKNKQIQLEFMQFWKKNPLIFGHVGGKYKKIMKCLFFFLVGHNFTAASEDLVDQTI